MVVSGVILNDISTHMEIAPVNLASFPAHDIFNICLWFNIFPAQKKPFFTVKLACIQASVVYGLSTMSLVSKDHVVF